MTGKEAIHLVWTASPEQVREWFRADETCATLRRVCLWRLKDDAGWHGLCRDLGLVELPAVTGCQRAEDLWREQYWTDADLAKEAKLTIATVKALRRTKLRNEPWATQAVGRHLKAYRLL